MKRLSILVGLFLSQDLFAYDACVTELASQPYCISLETAEYTCRETSWDVEPVKDCMKGYIKKYGVNASENIAIIHSACLLSKISSSDPSKNVSLCEGIK